MATPQELLEQAYGITPQPPQAVGNEPGAPPPTPYAPTPPGSITAGPSGSDPNYSNGYRTPQPFNTGYDGTGRNNNGGTSWSSGSQGHGYNMQPGSPGWEATQGAYEASQEAQRLALERLRGGNFMGSGYGGAAGNAAMQGYTNPQGFGAEALQGQRVMAADQFAGSRANTARNIEEMAQAKGFGDSMGLIDAQARAAAENTQGLNNAYNQIAWQNEQAKLQQQGIGAGMLGSFAGAEAQTGIAYALNSMNQQFPVIPNISQGPGGESPYGQQGSGGYWNSGGGYMPGQQPYDPFTGGQGGYTPQNRYSAF